MLHKTFLRSVQGDPTYLEEVEIVVSEYDKAGQVEYPHAIDVRAGDNYSSRTTVSLTKNQAKELAQALLDAVAFLES